MSTPTEDNDVQYVSPADFDEPGTPDDDIKVRDEVDLPILEEVVLYLEREIDKCTRIESLHADEKANGLTLEQQLVVQQELSRKLGLAKTSIQAIIEGIEEKYDDTNR